MLPYCYLTVRKNPQHTRTGSKCLLIIVRKNNSTFQDGECYELGQQGPCEPEEYLSITEDTFEPQCVLSRVGPDIEMVSQKYFVTCVRSSECTTWSRETSGLSRTGPWAAAWSSTEAASWTAGASAGRPSSSVPGGAEGSPEEGVNRTVKIVCINC